MYSTTFTTTNPNLIVAVQRHGSSVMISPKCRHACDCSVALICKYELTGHLYQLLHITKQCAAAVNVYMMRKLGMTEAALLADHMRNATVVISSLIHF